MAARLSACIRAPSAASITVATREHFPLAAGQASVGGSMEEEVIDDNTRATVKSIPRSFEMMQATKCVFESRLLPKSTTTAALVACALLVAGPVRSCLAAPSSQTTFQSPNEAGRALVSAV